MNFDDAIAKSDKGKIFIFISQPIWYYQPELPIP